MEQREEYEPIILDLQKSQAIRQPKNYFFVFIGSAAIFGVLVIFAAFYFQQFLSARFSSQTPPAQPSVVVTPTAVPTTGNPPEPTPAPQPPTEISTTSTGKLTLYSSPEHAKIVIDGNVLGYTPLVNYELAPGTYTVVFSHEGQISEQNITITADQTTAFTYRFEGFASLKIDTTSSGSDITVNGEPAGKSPLLLEGLSPGTYTIVASKVGYATVEKTITLKKGEHQELFMTIKRLDSVRPIPRTISPQPSRPLHPSERLRQ